MRVLYFHQHFSTPCGKAGIRSYQMARALVARGHQVTMVCGSYLGGVTGLNGTFHKGVRQGVVEGILVIEFDLSYSNADSFLKRTSTFFSFALKSIKIALTEQYDLVFATTTPLTAGIPGIFARWLKGKPFVFEVRDLWPELPKAMGVIKNPVMLWAMKALEWVSYRSAHHLIALSPGIVDGIARCGVSAERISMVPNGCDLDIFSGSVQPWRPTGVSETDLLAVFSGTHGIANGLDAVIDAAVELKRRGRSDIKLLLIGQGKLKPALQARVKKEDLDNVLFHDPVDKLRLSGLMAATDIGMQILANVPAFYFGTSPNKFFDYIAAGLPVLNNYPGWLAQMISEHQIGYTVPPGNPAAFANALEKAVMGRHGELVEMGKRAKEFAATSFNRTVLSAQWVNVLEKVLKETE